MDCPEARERMELYVLGGLSEEERSGVASHAASCPICQEILEEYAGLAAAIQAGAPAAPPSFEAGLGEVLHREIRSVRRRRATERAILTGTAASLVLGVLLWLRARPPADGRERARECWRIGKVLVEPVSTAGALVARGGRLYLVGAPEEGRRVSAVEAASGKLLWKSTVASLGYLAADDHRVYGLTEGEDRSVNLFALESSTGVLLWRIPSEEKRGGAAPGPPLPQGDRVVWGIGRSLLILQADTGGILGKHTAPGRGGFSNPAASEGLIYAAHPSALIALDPGSGRIVREHPLDPMASSGGRTLLAADSGRAFVARAGGGRLIALDLKEGRPIWERAISPPFHLQADRDLLYVRGDRILALDAATGTTRWVREAGGCSPITVEDGRIHLVDARGGGRLVTLDRRDGREVSNLRRGRSCDAFVRANGLGFLKTHDGVVRAFSF